uniref:AsIV-cont00009-ORF2 n=1 Tax=Apophua simplicipes ichnovirus TaxID=1329648 RepID=S5DMG2_9VIRU|nr:AsIV-cont00009-ORF2 [Apophua simplicipes ichnovirus]
MTLPSYRPWIMYSWENRNFSLKKVPSANHSEHFARISKFSSVPNIKYLSGSPESLIKKFSPFFVSQYEGGSTKSIWHFGTAGRGLVFLLLRCTVWAKHLIFGNIAATAAEAVATPAATIEPVFSFVVRAFVFIILTIRLPCICAEFGK